MCVCVCVCVCVVFVNDQANDGWFLFYCGLKPPWVMRVGFESTCTASGKSNVSRVIPRFYGWVYKTRRLFPLANEHSVAVMVGFSIKMIPDCILWVANSQFPFY